MNYWISAPSINVSIECKIFNINFVKTKRKQSKKDDGNIS